MRRHRWREPNYKISAERSGEMKFTAAQLAALKKKIVGSVITAQDSDYNSSRETFMLAFQQFPQIIVYCAGFSDVLACIRFAGDVGLHVVCRSGGHSAAGYSVNDEMVIDVSNINYVLIDPATETALVGAGARFAAINAALDLYGLHVPGGGCGDVGVAGYMQGGGYSFTSLLFGMNCDSVIGIQMALADGRIVTANANENEDLFWAVRGGTGNNFGVLLEIKYQLRKLGALWGVGFKWPLASDEEAAAASRALTVWQEHFTGAASPDGLGHQSLLVNTRNTGEKNLAPYFVFRGMYNGSESECRKALQPLIDLMPDEMKYRDIWERGSYSQLNDYLLNHPTELPPDVPLSVRSLAGSRIVERQLTPAEWREIVDLLRSAPSINNFIGLEPYGRAINAPEPDATAFWHRRASLDVVSYSFWLYESDRAKAEEYLRMFDRVVTPLSNGCSNQNYPNRENRNFGEMYFGGNLARLVEIKRKYDPADLFDFPQGLLHTAPAGRTSSAH